jgi:hypothetical protein
MALTCIHRRHCPKTEVKRVDAKAVITLMAVVMVATVEEATEEDTITLEVSNSPYHALDIHT